MSGEYASRYIQEGHKTSDKPVYGTVVFSACELHLCDLLGHTIKKQNGKEPSGEYASRYVHPPRHYRRDTRQATRLYMVP